MKKHKLAIIIVTHNSAYELKKNIESIRRCDIKAQQIIIVDSGSLDIDYLREYEGSREIEIIYEKNIGFCKANNLGYQKVDSDIQYVLFLNPDIIFLKNNVDTLINDLEDDEKIFSISPILYRYYIDNGYVKKTNEIDSCGIARTFYGRYYDLHDLNSSIKVFALCGAFLLCKRNVLDEIKNGNEIFNEKLFMYKEDIELCLRARKKGYYCKIKKDELVYHGRGWKKRSQVKKWQKVRSNENEFFLLKYQGYPLKIIHYIYYMLKKIYIRIFEN